MAISAAVIAASTVASTGYSIYAGEKARKTQKRAANQALTDAKKTAADADRAYNKANPKAPNVAALMKSQLDAGGQGVGGTFLTGAGGAPAASGMLGRSTQLGR